MAESDQAPAGTAEPMAKNREIIERIVADRIRTAHTMRCIVQGCYRPEGGACQFCGTVPEGFNLDTLLPAR